jgi:hypothetical protein
VDIYFAAVPGVHASTASTSHAGGWLSELPSFLERVTPGEASAGYQDHEGLMARLGGSGSSGLRISNSSQFHTFSRRICGFAHLNPTNSRMITTEIDGVDIHFIHVKSEHGNALPLIIDSRLAEVRDRTARHGRPAHRPDCVATSRSSRFMLWRGTSSSWTR